MSTGIFELDTLSEQAILHYEGVVYGHAECWSPGLGGPAAKCWRRLLDNGIQLLACQAEYFGAWFAKAVRGDSSPREVERLLYAWQESKRAAIKDCGPDSEKIRHWNALQAWDASPTTLALAYQMAEAYKKELACRTQSESR